MTAKTPSDRPKRKSVTSAPKYDLIEREITPEQQRAKFIAQDERFCRRMRWAIEDGLEKPQ